MWCSRYSSCVSLPSAEAGCLLDADRKDYFVMQQRVFFWQDKYIYNELL